MRNVIFIVVIILVLALGYSMGLNARFAKFFNNYTKIVMYKEPFGQKYHNDGCSKLYDEDGSIVEISLWKAKMQKLKPCETCNPQ